MIKRSGQGSETEVLFLVCSTPTRGRRNCRPELVSRLPQDNSIAAKTTAETITHIYLTLNYPAWHSRARRAFKLKVLWVARLAMDREADRPTDLVGELAKCAQVGGLQVILGGNKVAYKETVGSGGKRKRRQLELWDWG